MNWLRILEVLTPLLQAVVWPVVVVGLVVGFRRPILEMVAALSERVARGDEVEGWGIRLKPGDPLIEMPVERSPRQGSAVERQLLMASGVSEIPTLLITIGEMSAGEPSAVVGTGDALAAVVVRNSFACGSGVEVDVAVLRPRFAKLDRVLTESPNIVAIGGPLTNPIARKVFDAGSLSLFFDGWKVVDSGNGHAYASVVDRRKLSGTDYGVIAVVPNRDHRPGVLVLLCGVHGFGSHGAARAFCNLPEHPQLGELATGPFEAVVEVPFSRGVIEEPRVVLARKLDRLRLDK